MTNNEIRQKVEHFVLSTYLSEWNGDLPFCRILEAVADEDWDNATPWEPFERMDSQDLANCIADSVQYGLNLFKGE